MKHLVRSLCVLALFNFVVLAQEPNWNQFRGPNGINHSFSTGIAKSWPEGGPKELWRVDHLGGGFSHLCFYGDKMYTLGDHGDQCCVIAMNRADGKELWKTPFAKSGYSGGSQGVGPFATPACDGETVYVLGQHGDFAAFDAKDGKVLWNKNIIEAFGAQGFGRGGGRAWGYSQSPVIDDGKILLPVGGEDGALAAFDKTGKILWRTTQIKEPAAYTTVVPTTIGGVKQYMLLTNDTLAGISPADGKVLWQTGFPGRTAVCSDPVLCGDVIMASCAYNVGAYFYRLTKEGNNTKATEFKGGIQNLTSHHGGIVSVGDHFYLLTNSEMACVDAKTGEIVWNERSVGKGSIQYVDGVLIVRSERGDGTIAMVEATPAGYKELGRFNQPNRSDKSSWSYPMVVDKKLYIRDQGLLLCYDLN